MHSLRPGWQGDYCVFMFANRIFNGILLVLAAQLPGQALAQFHGARESELVLQEREFAVFGERRANSPDKHPSGRWTMFGRLGLVSVENNEGLTLKRSGPKLGRLTIGVRKRF